MATINDPNTSANITAVKAANAAAAGADAAAVVAVRPLPRANVGIQQTNVAVATETTIVTAGAAGIFNDIIGILITTAGLAAQTITIKDATGGTTRAVINYPNAALAPGAPFLFALPVPVPQAVAANNWTVTQSLATACNYTAVYAKNAS
jgi:hypothetical protein